MSLIRIDRDPTRRQLFVFGVCWLIFWGIVSALLHSGGRERYALGCGLAGLVVPLAGMIKLGILRFVYIGMSYLVFPIGFVISHVLMLVLFYGLLTPVGLLMRLLGHDPMERRFLSEADSYWQERKQERKPAEYFRQF